MSIDVERGLKPSGERGRRMLLNSSVRPSHTQVEMASTHLSGRLDMSRVVDLLLGPSATANTGEATLTTSSLPDNAGSQPAAPPRHDPGGAAAAGEGVRIEVRRPPSEAPGRGLVPADCGCGCG